MFLELEDYLIQIEQDDLDVLSASENGPTPEAIIEETEKNVILEISSYISGRYDVDQIFAATGDQRNALIKRHVINLALYELHGRINPRNIPEFRIQRRDDSIGWLKSVQDPRKNINADFLPVKDFGEKRGNDITWNSKAKVSHDY